VRRDKSSYIPRVSAPILTTVPFRSHRHHGGKKYKKLRKKPRETTVDYEKTIVPQTRFRQIPSSEVVCVCVYIYNISLSRRHVSHIFIILIHAYYTCTLFSRSRTIHTIAALDIFFPSHIFFTLVRRRSPDPFNFP